MNTLYHWVGFAVVWGIPTFLLSLWIWVGIWELWRRRPRTTFERRVGNAWTWVRVFVLGKRWLLPLEGARLLATVDSARKLDKWERDTFAFMIRYSKRMGWQQRP